MADRHNKFAGESAAELLQVLAACESITPDNSNCQQEIAARLEALGFACATLSYDSAHYGKPVHNLWATRGEQPYFVFCGHTDVVPPGDERLWSYAPFAPTEQEGYIYARGAVDMKGSIAAMLIALRGFLSARPGGNPGKGLALLITGDEEGEATDGVKRALEELITERGVKISQCLVGEPTCERRFGDVIKNGRRGSLRLTAEFSGAQQHNAYITKEENLLHRVLALANELLAEDWDREIQASPPGTAFNLVKLLAPSAAENVTAQRISLLCNWRYAPQLADRLPQLKERTAELITAAGFQLRAGESDAAASKGSGLSASAESDAATGANSAASTAAPATAGFTARLNWTTGAKPYYCAPQSLVQNLQAAIKEVAGTSAALSAAGGTSDGRFFPQYGIATAEFGPRNATIHCVDERLSVQELNQLAQTYLEFLKRHLA